MGRGLAASWSGTVATSGTRDSKAPPRAEAELWLLATLAVGEGDFP